MLLIIPISVSYCAVRRLLSKVQSIAEPHVVPVAVFVAPFFADVSTIDPFAVVPARIARTTECPPFVLVRRRP